MSLQDILKTINSEAEKEAEEIKNQGEEEIKKIEAEVLEQTKKEQEKILTRFRGEMEKKVKQAKFGRESKTKTKMLEKKHEVLDRVYDKVIEKIMSDDEVYRNAMRKVVDGLPKMTDAEIVLAKGNPSTRSVLSAALKGSARSGSSLRSKISKDLVDAKGGFVLRSRTLEINNTVEALIEQIRNETEIDVSRVLFG